jgi:pyruvate-ferredoxin/flavodoxin oxidoreductase
MYQALTCEKCTDEIKELYREWIENRKSTSKTRELTIKILPLIENCECKYCKEIYSLRNYLIKKSQWIIGGDGWAYDIGYGGLVHVLASGQNVNVLVLDTEVYSNTGGQSSKSTPAGAVAKFATSGKTIRKKDLGMMAMSYGYVYVAQVAMGASQNQFFRVMKDAEAYDGPSLIIAYSPCINHGLKAGMGISQREEKLAVECGYWHLYSYNPIMETEGKNPFTLDSKEPDWSKFQNFIKGEYRYSSLMESFPKQAEELFLATEQNAKWRYNQYRRLATGL